MARDNRRFWFMAVWFFLATASPALAQTILSRGSGFAGPTGVAMDGAGNVFVADSQSNAVKEILAQGGYSTVTTLAGAGSYGQAGGVAFDHQGNLFYGDAGYGIVYEALAADNFQTVKRIAGGFVSMNGIAVDADENVFVTSIAGSGVSSGIVSEIVATGGYAMVKTIGSGFMVPTGIAVDAADNVFVADGLANGVYELEAAGGYTKVDFILGDGNLAPAGLALDAQGNLYVTDALSDPSAPVVPNGRVQEIFAEGGYTKAQILGSGIVTPTAVAIDGAGNVFVTDGGVMSLGSGVYGAVKEIPAGNGAVVTLSTAVPYATGIALDPQGNLFVVSSSFAGVTKLSATDNYAVAGQYLADGLAEPQSVALDSAGNVYVADTYHGAVKEILAAGGYTSVQTLTTGLVQPYGIAVDGAGDIFVTEQGSASVKEIPAGGGAAKLLSHAFAWPTGIAADSAGNLYVSDFYLGTLSEIEAADGYQTVVPVGPGGIRANGLALDGSGNLFLASVEKGAIVELQKSDGYQTARTVANGFVYPIGAAVDGAGDVFVADEGSGSVPEILSTPSSLFAAILPGSRSTVAGGAPATVFATLVNAGTEALTGCSVSVSIYESQLLTLSYQQTDPTSNAPIGSPNTAFSIPGNGGMASLVLAVSGLGAISEPALAPAFGCVDGSTRNAAPVIAGVDTLDLNLSVTPTPDIIALTAATGGGVLTIPNASGAGAFALASIDAGTAGAITAAPVPSNASLPLTLTICPTDPVTAACTTPPAASAQINYAANGTQTYSVFATARGAIAFDPATARVFVHFTDIDGNDRGSTSVAVQTQ